MSNLRLTLTFLGTGTSTGVPQIGCRCEVCRSADPCDKRMRASALLRCGDKSLLIDCGPDFRTQALRADVRGIDAVLLTHGHYDHAGGLDDLRPFSARAGGMGIFCQPDVSKRIKEVMPYSFGTNYYPGAPVLNLCRVSPGQEFTVPGFPPIMPLEIWHTPKLQILGFRIGQLAYVTDCKFMPEGTLEQLKGVDTLVLNALRREAHPSHITLDEALGLISEIRPRVAYLTHMSHQMGLSGDIEKSLPKNVHLAYDGLTITI